MTHQAANFSNNLLNNLLANVRICHNSLKRNNYFVLNIFYQIQYMIMFFITLGQKLEMLKQRVNHAKYRLHQIETTINNNNQYKFNKGQAINQIR